MNASNQIVDQILEANPDWKAMKKRYAEPLIYFRRLQVASRIQPNFNFEFSYTAVKGSSVGVRINGSYSNAGLPPEVRDETPTSNECYILETEYSVVTHILRDSINRLVYPILDFANAFVAMYGESLDFQDMYKSDLLESWELDYKPLLKNMRFFNLSFSTRMEHGAYLDIQGKIKVSDFIKYADQADSRRRNGKPLSYKDYLKTI